MLEEEDPNCLSDVDEPSRAVPTLAFRRNENLLPELLDDASDDGISCAIMVGWLRALVLSF